MRSHFCHVRMWLSIASLVPDTPLEGPLGLLPAQYGRPQKGVSSRLVCQLVAKRWSHRSERGLGAIHGRERGTPATALRRLSSRGWAASRSRLHQVRQLHREVPVRLRTATAVSSGSQDAADTGRRGQCGCGTCTTSSGVTGSDQDAGHDRRGRKPAHAVLPR